MTYFGGVVLIVLMTMQSTSAQPNREYERQARGALDEFLVAWNTGDNVNVRQALNFPHVTHTPNGLIVAQQPEDFATNYQQLRQQGWASSRWDSVITYQVSEDKVNFGVEFSRLNAAGEAYQPGYVFYVFTRQDGHWGMQYRAPGSRNAQLPDAELQEARREATMAVSEFFQAFNAADNQALRQVQHVPQIMMNQGGYIYAENDNSPIVSVNFNGMREREDWQRSSIDALEAINMTPTQVVFELVFVRFDSEDQRYRTVPALWVLTRKSDRWGVEFRSLMEPTFER